MRLIDADAMIADLLTVDPHFEAMVHWCCTVVDAQPTVDAVEVVRCKDCKNYKKSEVSDRMMCWRKDVDGQPVCYDFNPNDFCSYGKRRTE